MTSRPTPAFASLIACLAFAGQLVAAMHMGLVRHDVCGEHGELIEQSAAQIAAESANAAHADLARAGFHDVRVDRGDSDDDHCLAITLAQSLAASGSVALAVHDAAAVVDVAHAAAPVEHGVVRAVLDVAPKQGPPLLHV